MPKINTHAPYGDPSNIINQSIGILQVNMQRSSMFGHLTGKFTSEELQRAKEGGTARTPKSKPILRALNYNARSGIEGKQGDEVTFNLINPVGAYPIMGSEYAEGRGTPISTTGDRLRVNQARFPVDLGSVMDDIRGPADFRKLGRPIAQDLIDRYTDQSLLVHAAGARGYHDNIEWVIPKEEHAQFEKIMVNRVRAPSKNRHFLADGDSIKPFGVTSGAVNLTSTDYLTMDVVDSFRALLDEMPLPPNPIQLSEDEGMEEPLRIMFVSPAQYNSFARDPGFRQYIAAAHARASTLNKHPLFLGDVGLWNGILIRKLPRPIRFYAGNPIHYCADSASETESVATVPTSFANAFAVDRAILLGGSAVAEALGGKRSGAAKGLPMFWSEKTFDHDDKAELLVGMIRGVSKIRFAVDRGDATEITDHGVIALDTVVPLVNG